MSAGMSQVWLCVRGGAGGADEWRAVGDAPEGRALELWRRVTPPDGRDEWSRVCGDDADRLPAADMAAPSAAAAAAPPAARAPLPTRPPFPDSLLPNTPCFGTPRLHHLLERAGLPNPNADILVSFWTPALAAGVAYDPDGVTEFRDSNGRLHRDDDFPAWVRCFGGILIEAQWRIHGVTHRISEPAAVNFTERAHVEYGEIKGDTGGLQRGPPSSAVILRCLCEVRHVWTYSSCAQTYYWGGTTINHIKVAPGPPWRDPA